MTSRLDKVFDILFSPTDDLAELARIAGADPRYFYEGANFRSASPTEDEKRRMSFDGAVNNDGPVLSIEEEHLLKNAPNLINSAAFDYSLDWTEEYKRKKQLLAKNLDEADPHFEAVTDGAFFSTSLNPTEKFRVLLSYPELSNFQKEELRKTFLEETSKFAQLAVDHAEDVGKLLKRAGYNSNDLKRAVDRLQSALPDHLDLPKEFRGLECDYWPPILVNIDFLLTTPIEATRTQNTFMLVSLLDWLVENYTEAQENDALKDMVSAKIRDIAEVLKRPSQILSPCLYFALALRRLASMKLSEAEKHTLLAAGAQHLNNTKPSTGNTYVELVPDALSFFASHHTDTANVCMDIIVRVSYHLGETQNYLEFTNVLSASDSICSLIEEESRSVIKDRINANAIEMFYMLGKHDRVKALAEQILERSTLKPSSLIVVEFFLWLIEPEVHDIDALITKLVALDTSEDQFGWSFSQIEPKLDTLPIDLQSKAFHFIHIYSRKAEQQNSEQAE